MTIFQIVRDIDLTSGGLSVSVPSLSTALSQVDGIRVVLIAKKSGNSRFVEISDDLQCHLLDGNDTRRLRILLDANQDEHSVVHINGLWDPFLHNGIVEARRRNIPHVVSVRGMLQPWAFNHKRLKKSAAWMLYQKHDLASAAAIHATSTSELDAIRGFGLSNPIAMIPNGINVISAPEFPASAEPRHSISRAKELFFLGRIHPIKGLDLLLEAWAKAGGTGGSGTNHSGWKLKICGPDEDDYASKLRAQSRRLGIEQSVEIIAEPITGAAKWDALRQADCLVLPSHSENFGIVVAEALSVGTPVIASQGAPWSELQTEGAGWWIDHSVEAFVSAIREAIQSSETDLATMGQKGMALIERKYAWNVLVRRYLDAYKWLANPSSKDHPDDIFSGNPRETGTASAAPRFSAIA